MDHNNIDKLIQNLLCVISLFASTTVFVILLAYNKLWKEQEEPATREHGVSLDRRDLGVLQSAAKKPAFRGFYSAPDREKWQSLQDTSHGVSDGDCERSQCQQVCAFQ